MYKELLDEAAANKRLKENINETNEKITGLKSSIKEKEF